MRAMLFAAIADALGWQTEFCKSREDVAKKFGSPFVEHFGSWKKRVGGRFHGFLDRMRPGDYSDDTQMTLMTARSLRKDGSFDPVYFSKVELPAFVSYCRGAGSTVKAAATKMQRKKTRWNTNFFKYNIRGKQADYRDAGANGVAMRVAPHALANLGRLEAGLRGVWQNAVTTHGHPRAILGALVYYLGLQLAAVSPDEEAFLQDLSGHVQELIVPSSDPDIEEWLELWDRDERRFAVAWDASLLEMQTLIEQLRNALRAEGDQQYLRAIGAYDPSTKGAGTVTVAAAIYFFLRYRSNPYTGIRRCVNMLGIDTDTVAGIAGGLWGVDSAGRDLPQDLAPVQDRKYLVEIDSRFGLAVPLGGGSGDDRSVSSVLIDAAAGSRVAHGLFGSGDVVDAWEDLTMAGGHVQVRRVLWDYGQSMVFAIRESRRSRIGTDHRTEF